MGLNLKFASVSYIRVSLDAPRHLDPKDILILFPSSTGGGMISFDDKKWTRDHPHLNGYHILLPGYTELLTNYAIDPIVPPEPSYLHVSTTN